MKRPTSIEPRGIAGEAPSKRLSETAVTRQKTDRSRLPAFFTLERNGIATLALSSPSLAQARRMVGQSWFVEELSRIHSAGAPLWRSDCKFTLRAATATEASAVEVARQLDGLRGEDTKFAFAFLVAIDAAVQ